jgi:hypothetical protein
MGEKNLKGEDQFVDKGEDGIILLKWILDKSGVNM